MDQYFEKIDKIVKGEQIKRKTKFMLMDLQDRRKYNWRPVKMGRSDFGRQTNEQFHREDQIDKIKKEAPYARLANQRFPRQGLWKCTKHCAFSILVEKKVWNIKLASKCLCVL